MDRYPCQVQSTSGCEEFVREEVQQFISVLGRRGHRPIGMREVRLTVISFPSLEWDQ
jgi:hypothetical protein